MTEASNTAACPVVMCGRRVEVEAADDPDRTYCWAHRPARYNLLRWPDKSVHTSGEPVNTSPRDVEAVECDVLLGGCGCGCPCQCGNCPVCGCEWRGSDA